MYRKLFSIISLVASLFVFTACTSNSGSTAPTEANILGIIQYESASYENTGPNTFAFSTSEFFPRKNFSGNKATLLWGLVTLKDY